LEPEKIKALAVLLGVDPVKLSMSLQDLDREQGQIDGGNFLKNFYFNPDVFMKLHQIDYEGLRKLVMPNLRKLRR